MAEASDRNPFQQSADYRRNAEIEFREFQRQAKDAFAKATTKNKRFKKLSDIFSFYTDIPDEYRVQAWFGQRSMFRKAADGKLGIEFGLTLLYSLGPTGDIVVALYPLQSNIARVKEDMIHLRIGHYTAHQLLEKVPSDINDLIAYGYVTSLDAKHTLFEGFRIWLLGKTRPTQVKGEFAKPAVMSFFWKATDWISKMAISTFVLVIMKPIGIALAIALLLYVGYPSLAHLLTPR